MGPNGFQCRPAPAGVAPHGPPGPTLLPFHAPGRASAHIRKSSVTRGSNVPQAAWLRGLLLAFCLGLHASPSGAGAWLQAPRGGYLKLSYLAVSANQQFGFDGGRRPIVDGLDDYPFADRSLLLYGEYGLSPRVTATLSLPLKRIYVHDRLFRYHSTGLGDLGVGLRVHLFQDGPWVGSTEAQFEVPTGYHRDYQPPIGSGQLNCSARLQLGRSFYPAPFYTTAMLGYRYRSDLFLSSIADSAHAGNAAHPDFSDQALFSLEGGWTPWGRGLLKVELSGARSFRSTGNAFSITSLPSTESSLRASGMAALRMPGGWSPYFEAGTTLSGKNTARAIQLSTGASTSW